MSLDDALFLVQRGADLKHSKGSDIGARMVAGDIVLVQRGTNRFKATYDGSGWDKIQDDDLLLAWDGTNNRSVTGENFKALFSTPCPGFPDGFTCDIYPDILSLGQGAVVNLSGMESGFSQFDYFDCYSATVEPGGLLAPFITPHLFGNNQPGFYYSDKVNKDQSFTTKVKFVNNSDPSDVHEFNSGFFKLRG